MAYTTINIEGLFAMYAQRRVRLFRNGRNQALRIPREFEFDGEEATIRKVGASLVVEPFVEPSGLLELLSTLGPINDSFPEIDELPIENDEIF